MDDIGLAFFKTPTLLYIVVSCFSSSEHQPIAVMKFIYRGSLLVGIQLI